MPSYSNEINILVERYALTKAQRSQLESLLELLASQPLAATSVRDPQQALRVHLSDSLSALEIDAVKVGRTALDIGTGAGFPGLPLAVALPELRVDLLEARARKLSFAVQAVEKLELRNVRTIPERAETWAEAEGSAAYELVFCRAVAALPTVLEYAAPSLSTGGCLVAWKGRRDQEEERRSDIAAEKLGMELQVVLAVEPYTGSTHRHLHLYRKTGKTPDSIPRRPGVARKRPLA